VAYDGTDFAGFQWQPPAKDRTVQGVLEAALARVAQPSTRVTGSGRTDSGVHASGQVVAFHVAWRHSLADLQRALNAVLPQDVVVLELAEAPEGWHPRFSALRRHYRYTVLNLPLRSPLERRYAHLVTEPLNLEAMRAGAGTLVGTHDFASFGRPTQGDSTVRHIYSADWQQDARRFTFDVVGNAFLRGMVRSIAGVLLRVGTGAWPVERVVAVLAARDRAAAGAPAPSCGLCLVEVEY